MNSGYRLRKVRIVCSPIFGVAFRLNGILNRMGEAILYHYRFAGTLHRVPGVPQGSEAALNCCFR
jgi:hypothetical protein